MKKIYLIPTSKVYSVQPLHQIAASPTTISTGSDIEGGEEIEGDARQNFGDLWSSPADDQENGNSGW